MAFKDDLAADLDDVFFNTDEFAEMIDFNGVQIKAIKSNVGLEAYKNVEYTAIRGTAKRYQRLSVKTVDLPETVFISATIYLGGVPWCVEDISDNSGVTGFVLSHVG